MNAMTRLRRRTLAAVAISTSVIGLAAGASAYTAPAAAPPHQASCHIDWFTHPWEAGSFGAAITMSTTRAVPNWLLQFSFAGSEKITSVNIDVIRWSQRGRSVTAHGTSEVRDLPAGQAVLGFPLTIKGTPSGAPSFTLNGRACSVSASTAITTTTSTTTPLTTTTTTPLTTTTTPTTTRSSTTTTTTTGYPVEGCSATYRILRQSDHDFDATITVAQVGGLGLTSQVRWTFSGDQQVSAVTAEGVATPVWSQTGNQVTIGDYPAGSRSHTVNFTASYTGSNLAPLSISSGAGCTIFFSPAETTTTT